MCIRDRLREHIPKQAVLGGLRVVVVHQPVNSGVPLRIEVLQRLGGGGFGCDADVDVAVGHEVLVAAAEDILQVIAGGGIQDIHIDIPGKLFRIFRVMAVSYTHLFLMLLDMFYYLLTCCCDA